MLASNSGWPYPAEECPLRFNHLARRRDFSGYLVAAYHDQKDLHKHTLDERSTHEKHVNSSFLAPVPRLSIPGLSSYMPQARLRPGAPLHS